MRPRRLATSLVLAAALAAASGCGENEEDKFAESYRPLNDRLLKFDRDLSAGLRDAEGKSNRQLSEQFAAFALRLQALNKGVRALEPPEDLEDERADLATQVDATVENLREISGAAGIDDAQTAAAATVELGASVEALSRARTELAEAAGAPVEPS